LNALIRRNSDFSIVDPYVLRESTDGGQTWTTTLLKTDPFFLSPTLGITSEGNPSPMVLAVDPFNQLRLVVGDNTKLKETVNGGTSWITLGNAPATGSAAFTTLTPITSVALATYQGTFQQDPSFPNIGDIGVNSNDSKTIYVADQGGDLFVTKDGINFVNRGGTGAGISFENSLGAAIAGWGTSTISSVVVDPTDRDTVYVTIKPASGTAGSDQVWRSTDAGLVWEDISAGLPDSPANSLAIDPRSGNIYVGTDVGLYMRPAVPVTGLLATTGNLADTFQPFGVGMPQVAVSSVQVNQNLNTLTVGTTGHGAFQFFLDDQQANSGALRAVSGSDVWTGPIMLAGPTLVSANGTQALQSSTPAAQLTVIGTISDLTTGAFRN